MGEKILITSALPYANGPIHFGHIAGAYLPADCYARYQRLRGNDVLYVCGSDEYGVAITMSAEKAGCSPREHVDRFHAINKKMFDKLHISFDHYSRTTWPGHVPTVQQFFLDLLENGFIEERVTDQLYSEKDQRFLADRYVEGSCPRCDYEKARGDECPACGASYDAIDLLHPVSKMTGAPLSRKPTKHWFLLLDRFKDRLFDWIATKDWKPNVVKFIKGYVDHMHARAITRDSEWGVPVPLPNTEGKVLYVWFDAPIGYISATKEWAEQQGNPDRWKDYWCDPTTKLVHFIGKDNIPFHATIFPAMIMGQNEPYKLVDELPANEFYHLEGKKFNKSEGWFIDMDDFFQHYTAEQIRYTIAANAPETADSEFAWKDFQLRCNADLLGKLGNFIHRTLVFLHKQREGKIPPSHSFEEIDQEFASAQQRLLEEISHAYATFQLRKATKKLMELAQEGNAYFDKKAPWKDAKDPENLSRMETTLHLCLQCAKNLALASLPILPETAEKIWHTLGFSKPLSSEQWNAIASLPIPPKQQCLKPEILFHKIEEEEIASHIATLHTLKEKKGKPMITIEDFAKLDLRVGVVTAAEPIEKSTKLLYLTVNIGDEDRHIVSGIRPHYSSENIVGKKVVVIANLQPAKVMGKVSEGMLLAGAKEDALEVVHVQNLPAGAVVS